MIQRSPTEEGRRSQRMAEQAVRDRLDDLIRRHGEDYASLSRRMGRNPAYIQQYIKRGVPRRLNELDRRMLARHFNVPETFLGAPDDSADGSTGQYPLPDEPPLVLRAAPAEHMLLDQPSQGADPALADPGGFLLVPYLEAFIAGLPPDAARAPGLAVATGAARRIAAGRLSQLRAMRLHSDSMLPTLAAGDDILIDCDDRVRLRDGIYAILSEGVPLVKRLSVHPVTKRLSVISDNPAYPSFADCEPDLVRVIGRVVWVGRSLP
jgi:hypothetical protein